MRKKNLLPGLTLIVVLAIVSSGCSSGSSSSNPPPPPPNPPDQVTGPSPADSAASVPVSTDLGWNAAGGATSYKVYLGPIPASLTLETTQASTTYDPGILDYSTDYYWRIDSVNSDGTTTGIVWSFTTEATPVSPPDQATGPSPADSASGVAITTNLVWSAAAGATSYEVYLGLTLPSLTLQSTQTSTAYDPGTLEYSTDYYWRIDSVNSYGTTTGILWSFTTESTPSLPEQAANPSPADSATDVSVTSNLSWDAANDTVSYEVYMGPTAASLTLMITQNSTVYNPGVLNYSTDHYWRIDSVNSIGTTTGVLWHFTTEASPAIPPDKVTGSSPPNGANNVSVETHLSWNIAGGATLYDIYFGTSFIFIPFQCTQTATSYYHGTLEYATTYYWRIDSYNSCGPTQGDVWSFTTEPLPSTPPGQAAAPVPPDGATGISLTPAICWSAAVGATSYKVYFGTNPIPVTLASTQSFTVFEPGTLNPSTTYYWRVDSVNAVNTTAGNVWQFTTGPAAAGAGPQVSVTCPADGAANIPVNTDLKWFAVDAALSYQVYFGTNPNPAYQGEQTPCTFDPGLLSTSTMYYWRIDVVTATGTVQGKVFSFTTEPGGAGRIIYVDIASGSNFNNGFTWANAVKTIGLGIQLAPNHWTVLVAPGTYAGPDNRDLDPDGKNLTIASISSPGFTVIDCQDAAQAFYISSGTCNIRGFTIKNGYSATDGGAILIANADSTVRLCIIKNCNAADDAGAIYYFQSPPNIDCCSFTGNTSTDLGGAIYIYSTSGSITNSVFADNTSNTAGGAVVLNTFSGSITNCLFVNNSSGIGGALRASAVSPLALSNCTFTTNTSTGSGGACYFSTGGSVSILDSILYLNTSGTALANELYSSITCTIDYCDTRTGNENVYGFGGCVTITNSIEEDPLFTSGPGGDFYLSSSAAGQAQNSPCIDAGSTTAAGAGLNHKTTRTDRVPDSGLVDGGYHYDP